MKRKVIKILLITIFLMLYLNVIIVNANVDINVMKEAPKEYVSPKFYDEYTMETIIILFNVILLVIYFIICYIIKSKNIKIKNNVKNFLVFYIITIILDILMSLDLQLNLQTDNTDIHYLYPLTTYAIFRKLLLIICISRLIINMYLICNIKKQNSLKGEK